MKKLRINKHSFKLGQISFAAIICCLLFGAAQSVQAQTLVTFAQFLEKTGSQDFVFTNNASSATFGTVSGGSAIDFRYSNISNLDASLRGFQDAHLFLSTTTAQAATVNTNTITQGFNGNPNTIRIIRDTPAIVGNGAHNNLLTVTFSPNNNVPSLVGSNLGNSASFSATTPDHTVVFTSDFLDFSISTQRNLALSFSSLLSDLRLDNGNFLKSFTAAGSGTFASNPPPTVIMAVTAAAVTISGRVLTSNGRGLRNAQVTMLQSDGSTSVAVTGIAGQFRFTNVPAGQSVILSVRSKLYQYAPQLFTPNDDLSGLNFTAQP